MKVKQTLFAIIVLAMAVATRTYGNTPDDAANSTTPSQAAVKIDNFNFSPAQITVSVGTTVRWTNGDDIPHTVVSNDKVFKSKVLDTDEQFTYTFTKAGTYPYFCSIHPKMTGTVVVR